MLEEITFSKKKLETEGLTLNFSEGLAYYTILDECFNLLCRPMRTHSNVVNFIYGVFEELVQKVYNNNEVPEDAVFYDGTNFKSYYEELKFVCSDLFNRYREYVPKSMCIKLAAILIYYQMNDSVVLKLLSSVIEMGIEITGMPDNYYDEVSYDERNLFVDWFYDCNFISDEMHSALKKNIDNFNAVYSALNFFTILPFQDNRFSKVYKNHSTLVILLTKSTASAAYYEYIFKFIDKKILITNLLDEFFKLKSSKLEIFTTIIPNLRIDEVREDMFIESPELDFTKEDIRKQYQNIFYDKNILIIVTEYLLQKMSDRRYHHKLKVLNLNKNVSKFQFSSGEHISIFEYIEKYYNYHSAINNEKFINFKSIKDFKTFFFETIIKE